MTAAGLPFPRWLAVSAALHLAAAGLVRAGMTLADRLPDREMVIDLTASFRTRAAALRAPEPSATPEPAAALPEAVPGPAAPGTAAEDQDGGEPDVPLREISALPQLRDRSALRAKLARYYPPRARAGGIEGVVTLEIVVSSRGKIGRATVVRADPPEFGAAALQACHELEFSPAIMNGRPVAVRIRLPMRFQLER